MNILLSIKPKWLEKIRNENKTFELRRVLPKGLKSGDVVYFYESSPVKAITAKCVVESVSSLKKGEHHIVGEAEVRENLTAIKELAKVSTSELGEYFKNSKFIYQGFKFNELKEIERPVFLGGFLDLNAPQNFCYLKNNHIEILNLIEGIKQTMKELTPPEKSFLHDMKKKFFEKYQDRIKQNDLKEIWANAVDEYRVYGCNPSFFAKNKADELIDQFMDRR